MNSPTTADKTPFPPPLMTSEPGSYARATIVERKPQLIHQVLEDNPYPPEIVAALKAFRDEIASQKLRPLVESRPDVAFWNAELAAFSGKTWLEIPWYFAETYFYRKTLEATRYFQPGEWYRRNPFQKQKDKQMEADVRRLAPAAEQFMGLDPLRRFEVLLHSSLWGNRADLSNLTISVQARSGLEADRERHLILIDHTERVLAMLSKRVRRVDFICDNVGSDLLFDLALADFLLEQGWVQEISLHLKNQPFFVSDAMPEDVQATLALLEASEAGALNGMGNRLSRALADGLLRLESDPFWTTCLMFRQMPPQVRQDLSEAALVLVKGDVNYRRLLDDRHWPYTTRMGDVTGYFPAPFVALRTLKGEIMVGLDSGQAEELQAEDPTWLINGKRGVIHLAIKELPTK